MGILGEEELQELAVVIEAVKQPSSVVDWGRESDGYTLDSYREHSVLLRVCSCHPLINIFYHNSSDVSSENFALDQPILSLFTYFLFFSLVSLISYL